VKGESYSAANPGQRVFIDQRYYNIVFNPAIEDSVQFNTTNEPISEFRQVEMKPE